jgi:D-alanine-D-alanine ligase
MKTLPIQSDSHIVILFGGSANERLVSTASAQNLASHMKAARIVFWDKNNAAAEVTAANLAAHANPFQNEFEPRQPHRVWASLEAALDELAKGDPRTVVFLALHGGDGENGVIQKKLEDRRLRYTCSDSRASALAFDKMKTKDALRAKGIHLAEEFPFKPNQESQKSELHRFLKTHGRIVVKPLADGSSFGLAFLDTAAQLDDWWSKARTDTRAFLAEERIEGRELTVGIVQRLNGVQAMPASEVVLERDAHFDYEGKYLGRGTREITPAEISPDELRQAQQVARLAHEALGCRGYTRTDMIFNARGFFFLETNTLPGLTKASFIPQQLAAAGVPIETFLAEQVALSRG